MWTYYFKYIMLLRIIYSISMLVTTRCSIVYDEAGERDFIDKCSGIDYSKYCNQIGICKPGTHVFCMYYKPGQIMSQNCDHGRMVRLSNSSKTQILDKMNGVRGEVAQGIATGENNATLPQGYGLIRLEWDPELAIFAQVWANQCKFTHDDVCRATDRFKNPGQVLGVFRYTFPNWTQEDAYNKNRVLSKKCLTQTKVNYAIETSIDLLITHKQYVTRNRVLDISNRTLKGNNYLMLLNSKATHVGCGMSAYRGYHWNDEWKNHEFYALQLVCNLSAQPIEGDKLYNVDPPPLDGKYSEKCGCPEGYDEDDDCLCVRNPHFIPTTSTTDAITTPDDTTRIDNTVTSSVMKTDASTSVTHTDSTRDPATTSSITNTDTVVTRDPGTTSSVTNTDTVTTRDPATTSSDTYTDTDMTRDPATTSFTTTDDSMTAITSSSPSPDTATAPDSENGKQKGEWSSNCVTNCSNQKQRVVVMPIIAMEDAPPESLNIDTQLNARNYNWRKFDKRPMEIAQSKKSMFTGVNKFVLPSAIVNRRSLHDVDSVLLNKDLKTFFDKVPTQERLRMEELFLKFVMKQQYHLIISTESPLMRPVKKYQAFNEVDEGIPNTNRNMYIKNSPETNIEEPIYAKLRTSDAKDNHDRQFWPKDSRRTGNVLENKETIGENHKAEMKFQLGMPIIRKQKPLVGNKQMGKYRENNNDEQLFHKDYSKVEKSDYFTQNDIRSVKNAHDVSHYEKKSERHIEPTYIEEHKINNHNTFAVDDFKVKKRDYLNNEINKLKNKLRHLRRNLRPNYKKKKERFRPVVTSNKGRENSKPEDVNRFYMPDRAYPLHDF